MVLLVSFRPLLDTHNLVVALLSGDHIPLFLSRFLLYNYFRTHLVVTAFCDLLLEHHDVVLLLILGGLGLLLVYRFSIRPLFEELVLIRDCATCQVL